MKTIFLLPKGAEGTVSLLPKGAEWTVSLLLKGAEGTVSVLLKGAEGTVSLLLKGAEGTISLRVRNGAKQDGFLRVPQGVEGTATGLKRGGGWGGGGAEEFVSTRVPTGMRLRGPFLCEFPEEVRNSFLHVLPMVLKELHVRGFPGSLKKPLGVSKGAEGPRRPFRQRFPGDSTEPFLINVLHREPIFYGFPRARMKRRWGSAFSSR